MILHVQEAKDEVDKIISHAITEIIEIGRRTTESTIGSLEDDINTMLRALQAKNKIYDYACVIEPGPLKFHGKIAYNLINSDDPKYESVIEFYF
jgi:hypothetical protein